MDSWLPWRPSFVFSLDCFIKWDWTNLMWKRVVMTTTCNFQTNKRPSLGSWSIDPFNWSRSQSQLTTTTIFLLKSFGSSTVFHLTWRTFTRPIKHQTFHVTNNFFTDWKKKLLISQISSCMTRISSRKLTICILIKIEFILIPLIESILICIGQCCTAGIRQVNPIVESIPQTVSLR